MADETSQPAAAPAPTPAPAAPAKRPKTSPAVRLGLLLGLGVVVVGGLLFGFEYWTHGRFVQKTNDAYVRADAVTVAPKIQGYVEEVFVADNQTVAAGQPLVKIDAASYDAALQSQVAT